MLELLEDVLGAPVLVPLLLGGAALSVARSPAWRSRLRALGVRGAALAMVAADAASRQGRAAVADSGGILHELTRRLGQAAAEVREEWEDFVAEARAERQRPPVGWSGVPAGSGDATGKTPEPPPDRTSAVHRPGVEPSGSQPAD